MRYESVLSIGGICTYGLNYRFLGYSSSPVHLAETKAARKMMTLTLASQLCKVGNCDNNDQVWQL